MAQPGYEPGSEPAWWWKVAMNLDAAQIALANAMAHNLDDPTKVFALQDRLREGQAILLEIFQAKGLVTTLTNGAAVAVPMVPVMPIATGVGAVPVMPIATGTNGAAVPSAPLAADEPAVHEADHVVAAGSAPEEPAAEASEQPVALPVEASLKSTEGTAG